MSRTPERSATLLVAGLAATVGAACAPAGLRGEPVPSLAWVAWAAVFTGALASFAARGVPPHRALARLSLLIVPLALLTLPAAIVAGPERGPALAAALGARALAATAAAAATAEWLGARGLLAALARLGLPARLVEVTAAALASLAIVARQVSAMLRARAARRPGRRAVERARAFAARDAARLRPPGRRPAAALAGAGRSARARA